MNYVNLLQSIPFYQIIDSIIKPPFEINPIEKFVAQEHNLVVNIPSKFVALLCNFHSQISSVTNKSNEEQQNQSSFSVLLRIFNQFASGHKDGDLEDSIPTGLVVCVNGKLAFSIARRNVSSETGYAIDLTEFILSELRQRSSTSNSESIANLPFSFSLELNWQINPSAAISSQRYRACIQFARVLAPYELLERLIADSRALIPADETKTLIISRLANCSFLEGHQNGSSDGDIEISTKTLKLSLLCPISKSHLITPVRGVNCTHLEGFDALAFFRVQLERQRRCGHPTAASSWRCPVCAQPASPDLIRLDALLLEVLEARLSLLQQRLLNAAPDQKAALSSSLNSVNSVLFSSDGSWRFESATDFFASPFPLSSVASAQSAVEGEEVQCVSVVAATRSRSSRALKRKRGSDSCDCREKLTVKADPDAPFGPESCPAMPFCSASTAASGSDSVDANTIKRPRCSRTVKEEEAPVLEPVLDAGSLTDAASASTSVSVSATLMSDCAPVVEHRGRRELTRRRDRAAPASEQAGSSGGDDESPSSRRLHERQQQQQPVAVKREKRSSSSRGSSDSDADSSDEQSDERESSMSSDEEEDEDEVWHDASDQPFF